MVYERDDNTFILTKRQRRKFMWTETDSRRHVVPSYGNALVQTNTRMRSCDTCGKLFVTSGDLQRHIELHHNGEKPIVCNVCGKRFGNAAQMTSHYKVHKEPRLEEFGVLMRRPVLQRDLVSPHSDVSKTTVGSYHGIPKRVKDYLSEPSITGRSFGTNQTFTIDSPTKTAQTGYRNPSTLNFATKGVSSYKLPDISSQVNTFKARREPTMMAQEKLYTEVQENRQPPTPQKLPSIQHQKVPNFDPGEISVLNSVMGVSKTIETNEKSRFTEKAEQQLIKARMDAIALASRPTTRQSLVSGDHMMAPDVRKHLIGSTTELHDGRLSHVTGRMSTSSGHVQYAGKRENSNSALRKFSLPRIG